MTKREPPPISLFTGERVPLDIPACENVAELRAALANLPPELPIRLRRRDGVKLEENDGLWDDDKFDYWQRSPFGGIDVQELEPWIVNLRAAMANEPLDELSTLVSDHIAKCEKHPMHGLKTELAQLKAEREDLMAKAATWQNEATTAAERIKQLEHEVAIWRGNYDRRVIGIAKVCEQRKLAVERFHMLWPIIIELRSLRCDILRGDQRPETVIGFERVFGKIEAAMDQIEKEAIDG